MNFIEKDTKCGKIKGIDQGDYLEFRGIKYAEAGRWEYPREVSSWDGVYDATYFKDCSFQRRSFEPDEVCNKFYHKEFRRGLSFTYSEDCFYLNILTPENAENCPVLIYIHGGSFTGGSTDESHLNGKVFAQNGIVFASMNYRLGPYGFCSHPDLTADGKCGNFGLYDQFTAIKWIKENIAQFGGNPDKITLCGQSAGAMSVDIHLTNPMCKDWFSGAILMSGAGLQRLALKPLEPSKTVVFWDEVMKNAGVGTMDELKAVEPKALYYAWFDACKTVKSSMRYTFPVYDGQLILKDKFKKSQLPDIPYMLGITISDMIPIVLKVISKSWAKSVNTCYTYLLHRALPGDDKGAWHACDLLYAFDTLDISWRPFEEADHKIANEMSEAFIAFAKNGNPNCSAIPHWDNNPTKAMIFSENTRFEHLPTRELIYNTIHGEVDF